MRLIQRAAVLSILGLATTGLLQTAASAASDAVIEGESLSVSSDSSVISDAKATGGSAMALWWTTNASGVATTTTSSSSLVLRARGDQYQGAPQVAVVVDGVKVSTHKVSSKSWTSYSVKGSWSAGAHTVTLRYTEGKYAGAGKDQNLYVDHVKFVGGQTAEPAPGPESPTTSPAPEAPVKPVSTVTAFVTGYTLFDNDPPGSKAIAYPTLHSVAGGTGTYDDPVTLAVGSGKYAAGTRFYIPHVKRYFVVEDLCASCNQRPHWVDMWIGGEKGDDPAAADACARRLTGTFAIEVNPPRGREVTPGPLFKGNRCSA